MSEGNNGTPEVSQEITLLIKLDKQTGQFSVQGPGNGQLLDEPMCYYLLEKAKDFIKASNMKAMESKLVKPGGIMNFARRGFK